ncbi:MAG: hypothetical protein E7J78_11755, partial [Pantoea sp.]|nr:hypothetical protein [Pantoea sp.]
KEINSSFFSKINSIPLSIYSLSLAFKEIEESFPSSFHPSISLTIVLPFFLSIAKYPCLTFLVSLYSLKYSGYYSKILL